MPNRDDEQQREHYEECPVSIFKSGECRCGAIDFEDEAYRAEPDDMFAREWGCF